MFQLPPFRRKYAFSDSQDLGHRSLGEGKPKSREETEKEDVVTVETMALRTPTT